MKKAAHAIMLSLALVLTGASVASAQGIALPEDAHNWFRGDDRPDLSSWPGKPSDHPVPVSFTLSEYVNCGLGGACTSYRCERFICTSDKGEEVDRRSLAMIEATINVVLRESGFFSSVTEGVEPSAIMELEFSSRDEMKVIGGEGMFMLSIFTVGVIPVASDMPISVRLTVKEGDEVRGSVEVKETPRLWFGLLLRLFMPHALTPEEFSQQLPLDLYRAAVQKASEEGFFDPADPHGAPDDPEKGGE